MFGGKMSYVPKDVRIATILALRKISDFGKSAFWDGFTTGLRIARRSLKEYGVTTYDCYVEALLRSKTPLSEVIEKYNLTSNFGTNLSQTDFVGEGWRDTESSEAYLDGLQMGMMCVPDLFHALRDNKVSRSEVVSMVLEYVRELGLWVYDQKYPIKQVLK